MSPAWWFRPPTAGTLLWDVLGGSRTEALRVRGGASFCVSMSVSLKLRIWKQSVSPEVIVVLAMSATFVVLLVM
jgi:hypothetical protein